MNEHIPAVRAAATVSGASAVGCLLLAIAHTGVSVPLLSRIGPQGGAVPPAVVAFAIGTVLFGSIAAGLWSGKRWAFIGGLVISVLSIASGLNQFRGAASAIGMILAVALAILLLLPRSRAAFWRS